MKCDHANAKFEILIERLTDAYIQISEICDTVSSYVMCRL